MILIDLMTMTNRTNDVDKYPVSILQVSAALKDPVDVLNPSITIQTNNNLSGINYMHIPAFNRFYFVTPESVQNGLWNLSGHVDVLYTYRSGIRSNRGIIAKQANLYNLYLNDPDYECYQNPYVFKRVFPNAGFTHQTFVLTLLGDHD